MTKIDIISGFLGAGKTTLIKKLLSEVYPNTNVVLIENEFGEIGIDGGFLKEAGIQIKEMNSGCICCSLVGDFGSSLKEVINQYHPERIIIEPSGVGKLSDVIKAVEALKDEIEIEISSKITVVDATKCKVYLKNFGEFFINQIEYAQTILLSRTDICSEEKSNKCLELIRNYNQSAAIITTPLEQLPIEKMMEAMTETVSLESQLVKEEVQEHCNHEGECSCGHHHNHDHDHNEHHDHNHDEHHSHNHEHQHHEEGCSCGCHDHGEEGHHHADDVFVSWGIETTHAFKEDEVKEALRALENEKIYGFVLRAKGMVPSVNNSWIYFDYVPGEIEIRTGQPDITGKICVIGSEIKKEALEQLFIQ